jgi:hypothetical protein
MALGEYLSYLNFLTTDGCIMIVDNFDTDVHHQEIVGHLFENSAYAIKSIKFWKRTVPYVAL